ncbi:hypothetical protein V5O48_010691 [Marasmius crinis-equi]|uniref:AMP-dependent synthetase/ligase domain-containing protein n=1 Tax=Marasmius crinis-equi TaxID=585013 RepID=A0ABR3F7U0_9AGAR
MTTPTSPLASLALAASQWPNAAIFKTPIINNHKNPIAPHIIGYDTVTYRQFHNYVETSARYWYAKLSEDGIPTGSIIGYCSRGGSYIDFVRIYGLSKAGYIPQIFTFLPQSIEVIPALLEKSGAKALLYQEEYLDSTINFKLKVGPGLKVYSTSSIIRDLPTTTQLSEALPDLLEPQPNDIMYILHSSGTTSGMPKIVPYTSRFVEVLLRKAAISGCLPPGTSPEIISMGGSAFHLSSFSLLMNVMHQGSCIVQPTSLPPPVEEFKSMFRLAGLNAIRLPAPVLSRILKASRTDSDLLDLLKALRSIRHSGAALPGNDFEWAELNKLNLVNSLGSTECGNPLMTSEGNEVGTPGFAYLHPVQLLKEDGTPLTHYMFERVAEGKGRDGSGVSVVLKELVVLRDSADLPHHSLLGGQEDFHTGDLYQEVKPGEYIHRGRVDDWIFMANAAKCDASSIEDDAKTLCRDLFSDCLAIGSNQPSPVLVVEALVSDGETKLRQDIFNRLVNSDSHKKRFRHEQIASPDAIIIVPPGSMARTAAKGTIRRKAVEEALADRIGAIFS